MNEVLLVTASSLITAIAGWLFSRKKQAAEIRSTEVDNVDKATKIWRDLAQELRDELSLLIKENAEMKQEIKKLEIKVQSLMRENKKLRQLLEKNGLTQ